jgi:hypothetical protein
MDGRAARLGRFQFTADSSHSSSPISISTVTRPLITSFRCQGPTISNLPVCPTIPAFPSFRLFNRLRARAAAGVQKEDM